MLIGERALTERRVVAKVSAALYVRLYALKLRTGRSLEKLLVEAIETLIETYAQQDKSEAGP